jgi:hypothetical protein
VDFQEALVGSGHPVVLGDIASNDAGALARVTVRLDAFGRPLPSQQCIDEGIANGSVPPGSQYGAQKLLLGALQQTGGKSRITVRIVDVATGNVESSALANANGTSDAAIRQAATAAIQKLGSF